MNDELQKKINDAMATLKLSAELSEHYYHKPLIICYSGGKDSDVMLDIAKKCLQPSQFEVLNSHTTVDAPETVYHIREVFKKCENDGIHTRILYPMYKGERTSMWKLIVDCGMPPTRLARYCCDYLKEQHTPNRIAAVGVREDESFNRTGRDTFATRGKTKKEAEYRSLSHVYAMFEIDKIGGGYECKFIESCKNNKDTLCNPIYKFTESDIWEYVKMYDIQMNPLYARGYKRVGCIGCPFGGSKSQKKEFADYPKFKDNYIRAFQRMIEKRERDGKVNNSCWDSGENVFKWWIGENPKQVTFDDIVKGDDESGDLNDIV